MSNKFKFVYSLIIIVVLFLSACGATSTSESVYGTSPDTIDQNLWNDAHMIIDIIEEMMDKKEDTAEEQNEHFAHFRTTYFVNEETFQNELHDSFTQEERIIILQTMSTIMTFRNNIFTLESTGEDELTETLIRLEDFRITADRFQND
ncbi:hypothetical protein [Halalkalibacter krulwichiae]|uniref:Uncharacterized protein n=1 Tax=Halalkalibacter krulwichiae TaxID=199441 RepID=A0A1X9MJH2_9BACI|nr:hypothetical protein [Halalkalibacter krulwichiae]ARK30752.1 hypothetical protein BkAM31D_13425 [Halalkalibacter krulwichiae]